MHDDTLSLGMFWAGALMVFAPLVFAGIVLAVWWRQRRRAPAAGTVTAPDVDPPESPLP